MGYVLITDGACKANGTGGIGLVFLKDSKLILEYSKQYQNVTNNKMELLAIIVGLKCIKQPIESLLVVSDSMYCIGCITLGWKRRKNISLWRIFDKVYEEVKTLCPNIEFKHVRGHQKDDSIFTKYNNRCDELAVKASNLVI